MMAGLLILNLHKLRKVLSEHTWSYHYCCSYNHFYRLLLLLLSLFSLLLLLLFLSFVVVVVVVVSSIYFSYFLSTNYSSFSSLMFMDLIPLWISFARRQKL